MAATATSCRSPLCALVILVILVSSGQPSFAVFQASSPDKGLTSEEGAAVYVKLINLLNLDKDWYDSGFSFADVHTMNGKRVALRYKRWTQDCTVGTWESATRGLVVEDFRTTVPYLRPFLLEGFSWAAVSNGYAWIDYFLFPDEATLELPSSTSLLNVSVARNGDYDLIASSSSLPRARMSTVSRYSPVDKTGFVDCPVLPFALLSHLNGIWDVLHEGEYLTSANKRIQLTMQSDCNLVLKDTQSNRMLWSTDTAGRGSGCFLRLQTEANLVVYTHAGAPVWAINQGCGCVKFSSLVIQDDGNLVVFRSENNKLNQVWATNTNV
ncbi:hypothetical protein SUGI_0735350 [Cryptomeria japonica]|uniref:uncharacterized protein LOC131857178 n=1 Tax=Cryptomeria japonica TaxID=3369 RepID=UPI00241487A8|nr:uncharacterized protein LOC131857178 [Cryptomeria japonica]GLJ36581.1 hypothetical protein SUGI_0735350 [Cryptomeria japonica]